MNHLSALLAILLAAPLGVAAQNSELFVPTNFLRAVEKQTRTTQGVPGERYFQNSSSYTINAEFDAKTGILKGEETIVYQNNSSDSLKNIVVRLYPNLFKANAQRLADVNAADLNDGVLLSSVEVDGKTYPSNQLKYVGTNAIIPLKQSIKAGKAATLKIEWSVSLPNNTNIRMGRYGDGTYFVAYWYPQIAVYDDINGWSTDSYNGLQEFYNDYNSYDVSITVPKGQLVWATGELQNAADIYTDTIIERISQAKKSDSLVRIVSSQDISNGTILRSNGSNIWRYKATDVPDFAFGVSDSYVWDALSVEVDHQTKRRAMVSATYKAGTKAGEGVAQIAARSIHEFSDNIIGVPYPYPHMTIFEGHFGMEFPMMCNDGPAESLPEKVFVTSHEVGHSYFPFMVGTNETLYGWVDEGLITVIPKEIDKIYGNPNPHTYIAAYSKRAMGTSNDIPLAVPSTNISPNNFMMLNYGRAATAFYLLKNLLGDDDFKKAIKEFIGRWKSKHPTPTDLIYTINSATGKDYTWFWNKWFYGYGYADLSIDKVVTDRDGITFTIKKIGSFPVPIKLTITYTDGTTEQVEQPLSVWEKNDSWSFIHSTKKTPAKIVLGDPNIPDLNTSNNLYSK